MRPRVMTGGVFQEKQRIADLPSLAQVNYLPLQAQPFAVIKLTRLTTEITFALEIIGPQCSAGILPADLMRLALGAAGEDAAGTAALLHGQPIPERGPFERPVYSSSLERAGPNEARHCSLRRLTRLSHRIQVSRPLSPPMPLGPVAKNVLHLCIQLGRSLLMSSRSRASNLSPRRLRRYR